MMRLPDKNLTASATMQGGAVAVLCAVVYAWQPVLGLSGEMVTALITTVGALGTFWALYGLRRRASSS